MMMMKMMVVVKVNRARPPAALNSPLLIQTQLSHINPMQWFSMRATGPPPVYWDSMSLMVLDIMNSFSISPLVYNKSISPQ